MTDTNNTTPPPLPELPDIDGVIQMATVRRDYFQKIIDDALIEVRAAEAIINRLGGKLEKTSTQTRRGSVSEAALCRILSVLANHAYAGTRTISSAASYSDSQVRFAMKIAEQRGWVKSERRGRYNKYRYSLTEQGIEFVTSEECK